MFRLRLTIILLKLFLILLHLVVIATSLYFGDVISNFLNIPNIFGLVIGFIIYSLICKCC